MDSELARAGHDPAVFEALYRRRVDAVTRFVARRVDDPHTAADLTAEVFLVVIDSAHTYRPELGTEIGWIFGVARNVMSAGQRRAARALRTTARAAGRRLLDTDDIARLEERIDAERAARHTYQQLTELPDGVRAVLELIAVDGLSVPEVIEQELRGYQVKSTVTFLPEGRQCKEPRAHYVPDSPRSPTLLTWDESNSGDSPPPLLLDVTSVKPSETIVLTLQYVKKGGPFVGMASLATGPVLPCKIISGGIQRFGHRQPVAPPQP
jgi:RNA polymerase sigma factor (sigma-70 family)